MSRTITRTPGPSPERIRRRVGELGEWFQNLNLRGVPTAPGHYLGDYPTAKWRQIATALPERMDGLTVLDVGCNAGFHALECKRRGARRVVGVDVSAQYLEQARFASEVLELEVEWRQLSVYDLGSLLAAEPASRFDYVFFMGLFYHLRYPLYALDLVVEAVGQRLVFQTMLRGAEAVELAQPDYSFWDDSPFANAALPRLHFIEQRYAGDPTNWWIPNRAAAEAMLRSAGLGILAHPEPETWICQPEPGALRAGRSLREEELAGTL